MVLLNGLPICDEKKAEKLVKLLMKTSDAKKLNILNIEVNFEEKDGAKIGTGQAFLELSNDADARVCATTFNGHKLDKKHIFSACTFPDFDKIISYGDDNKTSEDYKTQYLDLNNHMLECKNNQYAF